MKNHIITDGYGYYLSKYFLGDDGFTFWTNDPKDARRFWTKRAAEKLLRDGIEVTAKVIDRRDVDTTIYRSNQRGAN